MHPLVFKRADCLRVVVVVFVQTATLGIAKLFQFVPDSIRSTDLTDILYNMLKDKDTQVITNAIHALNEVLSNEASNAPQQGGSGSGQKQQTGGMVINHAIMMYLLNRIKEFNEWGQVKANNNTDRSRAPARRVLSILQMLTPSLPFFLSSFPPAAVSGVGSRC